MILCERAGIRRFLIETPTARRAEAQAALGRFRDNPAVCLVESLADASEDIEPSTPCVRFTGNLVMAQSNLRRALAQYAASPGGTLTINSADPEQGGAIIVGPLRNLLDGDAAGAARPDRMVTGVLPFALNGRPEDRNEAEVRLARAVRDESVASDAPMARWLDRRLSWRLSLPLARRRVSPNAVTLANTALGFGCAAMLASTSYWLRLLGAMLFVVSTTIDGVDGELARLRMVETKFGGKLDVFTDNLVHVAIFAGLMTGCYRVNHSAAYLYLLLILLAGFSLCAVSVDRALRVAGASTSRWISKVERATGRDFAYIVLILAIANRLAWFAWTAAVGCYAFAFVLWILTSRQRQGS
ncbi:MAG TPA: CDP-alcohol phosphatidyltransferase family protein [Candidatus Binataceae bacterium]|nr:CDP-alcohol phosphatidyltransferase family protein [Candidatus Binataceae bacterium]